MRRYKIEIRGKEYVVYVKEISASRFKVILNDAVTEVQLLSDQNLAESLITPEIVPPGSGDEHLIERPKVAYSPPSAEEIKTLPRSPSPALPPKPTLPADGVFEEVTAPMPGVILSIEVKPGESVSRGQPLLVLEAMKMKNPIKSPREGTVSAVSVHAGQCVSYGDVLVTFEREGQS